MARRDGRLVTADDDEWPLLSFTGFARMDHRQRPQAHPPLALWVVGLGPPRRHGATRGRDRRNQGMHRLRRARRRGPGRGSGRARRDGGVGRRLRHRRCRAPRDAGHRRVHRRGARRRYRHPIPVRACRAAAPDRSGRAGGERVSTRRASGPPSIPDPQPAGRRVVGRDRGRRGRCPQRGGEHRGVGARRWVARCARCPGPITSAASVGCHALLRDEANLVTRAADVVELIGRIGELAPDEERPDSLLDGLGEAEQRVYDALPARGRRTADQIAVASGLAADAGARARCRCWKCAV